MSGEEEKNRDTDTDSSPKRSQRTKKRPRCNLQINSDSSESEEQDDVGVENNLGESEDEGPDEEFEIEKILARRLVPATGKFEYMIKWVGYPDSKNTWEPAYGLEEQYANWVADYNRAEDEQIKFKELQEVVTLLLSVSKAPPEFFDGVDFSGLGVVLPGKEPTTTNENGKETVKEELEEDISGHEDNAEVDHFQEFVVSSNRPEVAQVEDDAKPVGAPQANADNAPEPENLSQGADDESPNDDDPMEGSSFTESGASGNQSQDKVLEQIGPVSMQVVAGHEMEVEQAHPSSVISAGVDQDHDKALDLAAPSNTTENDPVIMFTSSVPQADIFKTNQRLMNQNNFLELRLAEKSKRIEDLVTEVKTVKESRRLVETKLSHEKNELKDALKENAQNKKDLEAKTKENYLLQKQLKELLRENEQLVESLNEKDISVSTLEEKVESLETINDQFQEKLFKQKETIGKLELAQNMTLDANLAALTTERDRLDGMLAAEQDRVSNLQRDLMILGGVRATNQHLRDILTSKDVIIASLKRDFDDLELHGEQQKSTLKEMEAKYKQQLAEMEDGWQVTKAKNVRLNLRVGHLIHKLSLQRDNLQQARELRRENLELKNDLKRKESRVRENTKKHQSCVKQEQHRQQ